MNDNLAKLIKDRKNRAKEFNTHAVGKIKKRVASYSTDIGKHHRLSMQICKTCYYITSEMTADVGGRIAMKYTCDICGKELETNAAEIGYYCIKCAAEHGLCTQCGGEM